MNPWNEVPLPDVTCPFCGDFDWSQLLAIGDVTFNEWWEEGYMFDRVNEFRNLIEESFQRMLKSGSQPPPLANPELDQLWREVQDDFLNAKETSATGHPPEFSLDSIALNRLLIELLTKAGAAHLDAVDDWGAAGFASTMSVLYAKDPPSVFNVAFKELKRLLA
jgi:hypothetical protein